MDRLDAVGTEQWALWNISCNLPISAEGQTGLVFVIKIFHKYIQLKMQNRSNKSRGGKQNGDVTSVVSTYCGQTARVAWTRSVSYGIIVMVASCPLRTVEFFARRVPFRKVKETHAAIKVRGRGWYDKGCWTLLSDSRITSLNTRPSAFSLLIIFILPSVSR